jgi:hypothetical protein
MAMLAFIEPGDTASNRVRVMMIGIGIAMFVLALLPAHLNLTGTVLAFICLGLALHMGLFGIFGIGFPGLAPAILVGIGIVCRRARLDQGVLIIGLVGFSLALWTPLPVLFAMAVVGIVNVFFLVNRIPSRNWHR